MDKVSPCGKHNAIKNVAFAFEFASPLQASVVKELIDMYKKDPALSQALPRMQPIESFTFQLGMPTPVANVVGVIFDKLRSNGEQDWAVIIRPDAFIVSCAEYTEWKSIYSQARGYIEKINPFLQQCPLSAIGLEYIDEFKIANLGDASWIYELFRPESRFLVSNIKERDGSWHLHQGFWEPLYHGQSRYNRLINVDLDCLEDAHGSVARIRHLQKTSDLGNLSLTEIINCDLFDVMFTEKHKENLIFIRDILSDSILEKIKVDIK